MDGSTVVDGDRTESNSSCVGEIDEKCILFEDNFCSNDALSMESEMNRVSNTVLASKNHKEAERRRREKINSRLHYLRQILPCNSKIDKASLMAKVIERINEMNQKTTDIRKMDLTPSENDEVVVLSTDFSGEGRSMFKASLCCDDRSDLIPDLIEKLRSLRLRTLRLEMAKIGRRIRHMFVLVEEGEGDAHVSVELLEKTLMSILECSVSSNRRSKRRRCMNEELKC